MSLELTLLIWSVGLAIAQLLVAFAGVTLEFGLPDIPGNRKPPMTAWAGRAQHASRDMLESLVLFAILVVAAELTNRSNASTGLGAEVFFVTRAIYAIVAVIGMPWLRAAVWCIATAALVLIFVQLL